MEKEFKLKLRAGVVNPIEPLNIKDYAELTLGRYRVKETAQQNKGVERD